MGTADQPVNIWQWKAVWQRDIDDGFADSSDRYPNTYADFYSITGGFPDAPAADVGNPLSQATHASPIENAIAEGFGTLTTSTAQDVQGSGEWREGRWRVVFARALAPSTEGLASFAHDETTQVALAVWDGGSGDRNGQKSIAQFIAVQIGSAASDTTPPTVVWVGMLVMIGAVITATAAVAIADRSRGRDR